VWDDVVEDVHARDAGVASSGDGLEGGDDDGGDGAECVLEGFRGTTSPVVEQFAFVMMNPLEREYILRWWGMTEKWLMLTRGTMSGTRGSRR